MQEIIQTIIENENWHDKKSPYHELIKQLATINDNDLKSYIPNYDPEYVLNQKIAKYIMAGLIFNKTILINGLHGVGKSTHIEQVCAVLKYPVLRLNMDAMIERSDLVGRDGVINDNGHSITTFKTGMLTWAIQQPIVLIIDELDMADHNILMLLQKILEHNSFNLLEENKVIALHPQFRIFATSNTLGDGDDNGIYTGVNFINQAHLDRWDMVVKFDTYKGEELQQMIINKYPKWKKKDIKKIVQLYELLYDAFQQRLINHLFSIRNVLSFCHNYTILNSYNESFQVAFANKLNQSDQLLIQEIWQRIFNNNLYEN